MKTAHNLKATIEALKAECVPAVREIASALNTRGIATSQGKQWHSTSVHRLLKRLEIAA